MDTLFNDGRCSMRALIDGDIVVYRAACSCEKIPTLQDLAAMGKDTSERESLIEVQPVGIAYYRLDELMTNILLETESSLFTVYLTGPNNFRTAINPEYKANRKDLRKPAHFNACREYLVTKWGAIVTDGIEADDAMGIAQGDDTIICTIDKDLDTIVGRHYHFVKKLLYEVDKEFATKFLWKQMLIGDKVDNIIGIKGIGPKKAEVGRAHV